MGTEKTSSSAVPKSNHYRCKPPPVPPRPQHLTPAKAISKYSSMPDILNGWKRDTSSNPDLLKLHTSKRSIVDIMRPDCVKTHKTTNGASAYPSIHHATSNEYLPEKTVLIMSRSIGNNYTMSPSSIRNESEKSGNKTDSFINGSCCSGGGNGKTSKKLSCLPSRSNSKKKQQQKNTINSNNERIDGNHRYGKSNADNQISQTSWYVEDVQLSDEVNVDIPTATTTMTASTTTVPYHSSRYASTPPSKTVAVDYCVYSSSNDDSARHSSNGTKDNVSNIFQRTYRKPHQQSLQQLPSPLPRTQRMKMSSTSLSNLPPLPRSFSDASLLWETTNKTLSTCPVNLSPARSSNNSSPSRSRRNIVHPKVPPPAVPRSNSVSSDDQPKVSAVYVNSLSVGGKKIVTSWPIEGDSTILRDERPPPPPPPRKPTSLDMKLSILRKEMHVLRQMDLSLLSQLWSLNESIHEFRQRQELLSPNSAYLNSSDEEDSGCYHSNISSLGIVTSNNNSNNHHNTLGSSSSRSSISTTGLSTHLRDGTKP